MSCSRPLKGFAVGTTSKGKTDYLITSYKVHHLERCKNGYKKVYSNTISPYTDRVISTFIEIPCGVCLDCRLAKARMWQDRIMLEMKNYENNCFITLTYDDNNLPKSNVQLVDEHTGDVSYEESGEYNSLCKRDMQLFWKRLRKITGKKVRFFMCGEYGSSTARPHYHAIVFGWKPDDLVVYSKNDRGDILYNSELLNKVWNKGHVIVGEASFESAGYVARYTLKKVIESEPDFYKVNGITPPYICMSRRPGIGRDYYEQHKNTDLFEHEHLVIPSAKGGRLSKVPKYFVSLYDAEYPDALKEYKDKNIVYARDARTLRLNNTDKDFLEMLASDEYNLENRTKILKQRKGA